MIAGRNRVAVAKVHTIVYRSDSDQRVTRREPDAPSSVGSG